MNAQGSSKIYNFFKLAVALILVVIIVILWIRIPDSDTEASAEPSDTPKPTSTLPPTATEVPEPTSTPEPTQTPETLSGVPELPDSPVELIHNPGDSLAYTPDGNPVYRLNTNTDSWEPYIAPDLAVGLPQGARLVSDEANGWQISDKDGNPLYDWNPDTLTWDATDSLIVTDSDLPPFPETTVDLVYVPETDQLESPDGLALFQLDAENGRWIPVIPEGIAADLPEDAQPVLNDSGIWEVFGSTGNPVYAWDWIALTWLPADQEVSVPPLPEAPSQDACPLAMVPRLAVGAIARAVSFQNFRSSPEVSDNLVYVLAPTSEVPVIGGPLCIEYNGGAHLWWEVAIDDGTAGWMAEGSADGLFYFLEPVW